MRKLVLTHSSRDYEITPERTPFTIGRFQENDLCLPHEVVSGHHGRVVFQNGEFLFEDLSSTNGSLVTRAKGGDDFIRGTWVMLRDQGSIHLGRTGPVISFCVKEDAAQERDPFESSLGLALNDLKRGDFQKAATTFESLIKEKPDYLPAYYYAGFAASHLGDLGKAVLRFEQYLMIHPDDTGILLDLGKIYERQGNLDKAFQCYRGVLMRSPGNKEAEERMREVSRFEPGSPGATQAKKTKDILGDNIVASIDMNPFHVSYTLAAHGRILTDVMKALRISWQEVGEVLQHFPESPVPVTLMMPRGGASGRTGPEGVVLMVDQEHLSERAFLEVLVRHEYAHYALGSMTSFASAVPWWFQEGFAQYVSQTITPGRLSQLKGLADSGQLIPLQVLEKGLSSIKDKDVLNASYLEAHTAVAFVFKKSGHEGLRRLINGFRGGDGAIRAFRSLKWDYGEFEREWTQWLKESVGSGVPRLTREVL
jgi:tetratricopeptide (TPR) repeat protein